jgi:hypothetical protein
MAADPKAPTRIWQDVFEEIIKLKHGETRCTTTIILPKGKNNRR